MRLAFVVNDVATEIDEDTTPRLARAAAQAGHETWYLGVGDLELGSDEGSIRRGFQSCMDSPTISWPGTHG